MTLGKKTYNIIPSHSTQFVCTRFLAEANPADENGKDIISSADVLINCRAKCDSQSSQMWTIWQGDL